MKLQTTKSVNDVHYYIEALVIIVLLNKLPIVFFKTKYTRHRCLVVHGPNDERQFSTVVFLPASRFKSKPYHTSGVVASCGFDS